MSRLKPLRSYKTYLLSGMLPFLLLIVPLVTTTGCGDEESRSGAASTEPAEEVPAGSPEDPSSTDGTEESPTLGELLGGVICSSLGFDPTLGGGVLVLQYTPKSGTVEDVVKIKGVTGCATEKFSLENVDQIRFIPIITVDDQGHTDCQMPEGSEPLATLGSEEFTKRGTSLEFSVPSLKTDGWVGIEIYKGEQRIDLYYDDPEDPSDTPNKGCLAFDYQLSLGEVTDEILDTLENTIDDVTDLLDDGDEEDGSVI
ncbi:MAG: hypothetical protein HY538_02865, partial [Deltaproteobacteria bacterium]|nr:hypothetical protein [Deltaproteobacteria bacterium]